MYYRSLTDLNDAVIAWLPRLPSRIDLVVGIPRSGLLVANLIALYRGLPMTDVDGLIAGRLLSPPDVPDAARSLGPGPLTVLVVDDSVYSGKELLRTRARLAAANLPHRLIFGAAYLRPGRRGSVDTYAELLPSPRAFEWNLMHHPYLEVSCLEIDGVLCPVPGTTGPGPADPLPLVRPTAKLGWLVTARPERERARTEAWLARHGIGYRGLSMAPDGETPAASVRRKALAYRQSRAWLFLDGDQGVAAAIAMLARRPVFSAAGRTLIYPGGDTRPGLFDHLSGAADAVRFALERRLQRRAVPALRSLPQADGSGSQPLRGQADVRVSS